MQTRSVGMAKMAELIYGATIHQERNGLGEEFLVAQFPGDPDENLVAQTYGWSRAQGRDPRICPRAQNICHVVLVRQDGDLIKLVAGNRGRNLGKIPVNDVHDGCERFWVVFRQRNGPIRIHLSIL